MYTGGDEHYHNMTYKDLSVLNIFHQTREFVIIVRDPAAAKRQLEIGNAQHSTIAYGALHDLVLTSLVSLLPEMMSGPILSFCSLISDVQRLSHHLLQVAHNLK